MDEYCDSTTATSNLINVYDQNTTLVVLYYYSKNFEHICRFYKYDVIFYSIIYLTIYTQVKLNSSKNISYPC